MKKNKTATLIATILVLSMTLSFMAIPNANAATLKTYPVIGATPNPVGVGQDTLILIGITQPLVSSLYGWQDLTITITKPDGTTQTMGPYDTDSTGMTGVQYKPDTLGNYTLQMHFPEQLNPADSGGFFGTFVAKGTTMLASDSIKVTLVVQEERTQQYPTIPLPTEFWTRPVDDQLREWSSIDGNWLTTPPNFLAFGNEQAPQSAHILWTKPLTSGGQVGGTLDPSQEILTQTSQSGQSGQVGYDTGDAYEGKWSGSLVLGGKLYYQKYASGDPYKEIVCVDLHTGQQLWSRVLGNNMTLTRGQLVYWQTMDFYGVYDYLWYTAGGLGLGGVPGAAGGTMVAFDPYTGDWVCNITGVPSGTTVYGPHGELLIYTLNQQNGWMTMWNSSNIPAEYASTVYGSMGWSQWRPMGKVFNGTGPANVIINRNDGKGNVPFYSYLTPVNDSSGVPLSGYNWNVTIPKGLPGSVRMAVAQDKMVGGVANTTDVIVWAIDLRPGREGQLLYNNDWKAPSEWLEGNLSIGFGAQSFIDKVITVNARESRMRYGFSLENGQYLWQTSEPIAMLGHLVGGPSGENGYIVYGMLISGTMSGVVQAFNVTNGQLVWKYEVRDPSMQALWSNNWPVGHLIAANGMIYFANLEHSGNQPLPRGGPFVALNATTGEVVWRANGLFRQTVWGGRAVIGDSIIATMDTYDQRVYAIGKGPSATTVSVGPKASTLGTSVVIEGKVTDVSPGTNDVALAARFPTGVPAVSDESQSDWMLYVYKQFPRPTDATGVEVTLSVLDSNGNYRDIGKTTANSDGFFSYQWTPDITGKYTVYASFAGSKSYWPSHADTAFAVDSAPEAPSTQVPTQPVSNTDTYVLGTGIAIIVAIAIVGAVILMVLRKRP